MSVRKQKHKPKRTTDATAWILGTTIVVLATLDLLVWATLHNAPNPISKALADFSQISGPLTRTAAY